MIRRSTYIQLIAFAVISVLGVLFVGANYVGIFQLHGPYTVKAYFTDSGGIFTNAGVTERGVNVGKVGSLNLVPQGGPCQASQGCVEVDLKINHGTKIPATGVHATIANLSAVGEQYVDLEPARATGPVLTKTSTIASDATTLPVDNNKVLVDLNDLLKSVNNKQLATVIDQLGVGFDNLGPTLQRLIDNGDALTKDAITNLPQTLSLIDDGKTVLDTQRDVAGELKSFAASFAKFSGQLRVSDPSLRGVLNHGVDASKQVRTLLASNSTVLPTLLSNLITFNGIQAVRIPQVRTVLEIYPADTAAGFHTTPGDGTAHFGQITDSSSPCQADAFKTTTTRSNTPAGWGGAANLDAYCHGSGASGDNRGSRFIPRPAGDNANITNSSPYPGPKYHAKSGSSSSSTSGAGSTGSSSSSTGSSSQSSGSTGSASPTTIVELPYDPSTGLLTGVDGNTYQLGFNGPTAPLFGTSSWEALLLAPTMK